MISALAEAGAALWQRADYVDAAAQCAEFLLATCEIDGQLLRTWKDGPALTSRITPTCARRC